jgi:hypothetical protein
MSVDCKVEIAESEAELKHLLRKTASDKERIQLLYLLMFLTGYKHREIWEILISEFLGSLANGLPYTQNWEYLG